MQTQSQPAPQLHRVQCCAYKVLQNPTPDLTMAQIEDFVKLARWESGHDNVHRQFTTIVTYTEGEKGTIANLKKLGFEKMEAKGDLKGMELWTLDIQKIHPTSGRRY